MTKSLKHAAITGLAALALAMPATAESRDRARPRIGAVGSSAYTRHPRPDGIPHHLRNGIPYRHHRQFDVFLSFNFGNVIFDGYYTNGRMFPFGCGPYGRYSRHQIMQMQAMNVSRPNPPIYAQRQMYGYGYANEQLEERVERLEERDDDIARLVRTPVQPVPTPQPTPAPVQERVIERIVEKEVPVSRDVILDMGYSGTICPEQYAGKGDLILNRAFDEHSAAHGGEKYHAFEHYGSNGYLMTFIRDGNDKTVKIVDYSLFKGMAPKANEPLNYPTVQEFTRYIDGVLGDLNIDRASLFSVMPGVHTVYRCGGPPVDANRLKK